MTNLRSESRSSGPIARRHKLLKQIKSWVFGYVGRESPTLRKYSAPYKKEFSGQWNISSVDQLFEELKNTNIIFGADFHGYAQAQRTHLRILRSLSRQKKVILGLEIFESKHQRLIDDYVAGRLTEKKFLEQIRWRDQWGFPWSQYKPLLEFAIKRGHKVIGLNRLFDNRSSQTLKKRDVHAAKLIARSAKANPSKLLCIIYGDLHVATPHLPRLVLKNFPRPPNHLILFQNSERLYFKLAKKGLEKKFRS